MNKFTRPAEQLLSNIMISQFLARKRGGATVGEINKSMTNLSRGQIQRVLNVLIELGYVAWEQQKHGRTGKIVYRLTEGYVMEFADVVRSYSEFCN